MYKNYLWASSRLSYVKKKHAKIEGCLFCNIARDDPKTPKKVLWKDADMMVIMNIFPYNTGHLEVVHHPRTVGGHSRKPSLLQQINHHVPDRRRLVCRRRQPTLREGLRGRRGAGHRRLRR